MKIDHLKDIISNKFILASNNQGKIREFQDMFKELGIDIISMREAGIEIDIPEIGSTFEENAYIKAKTIVDLTGIATIADDSGLEIEYLNNEPGVFSARYAGEKALDSENIEKVLSKLCGVPMEKRDARFVCVIKCIIPSSGSEEDIEITGIGQCRGRIALNSVGMNGFGYDSIFLMGDKTFAQMNADEKNRVSHRGNAMRDFAIKIKEILK